MQKGSGIAVATATNHDFGVTGAAFGLRLRRNRCFKSVEPFFDERSIVERRADQRPPRGRKNDVDVILARRRHALDFHPRLRQVASHQRAECSEGIGHLLTMAAAGLFRHAQRAIDFRSRFLMKPEERKTHRSVGVRAGCDGDRPAGFRRRDPGRELPPKKIEVADGHRNERRDVVEAERDIRCLYAVRGDRRDRDDIARGSETRTSPRATPGRSARGSAHGIPWRPSGPASLRAAPSVPAVPRRTP